MTPETAAKPDLRALMSGFPTGVCIVTAFARGGEPWGMTCTSLCSVALEPPTLLVCLRRDSPTLEAVLSSGRLAVNLLHEDARSAAELFASGAADRFDRIPWRAGERDGGPHLLEAAHMIADCVVSDERVVGDHAVVMAEVTAVSRLDRRPPLMYGMRRYGAWTESAEEILLRYDFFS